MRKLTVFIEGESEAGFSSRGKFDRSILITGDSYLLVKTAAVYWNYNNVFTEYNDQASGSKARRSILAEGYWTFQMLVDKLKGEDITLEASEVNEKCSILHNDLLFLGRFGELLGLPATAIIIPRLNPPIKLT